MNLSETTKALLETFFEANYNEAVATCVYLQHQIATLPQFRLEDRPDEEIREEIYRLQKFIKSVEDAKKELFPENDNHVQNQSTSKNPRTKGSQGN